MRSVTCSLLHVAGLKVSGVVWVYFSDRVFDPMVRVCHILGVCRLLGCVGKGHEVCSL